MTKIRTNTIGSQTYARRNLREQGLSEVALTKTRTPLGAPECPLTAGGRALVSVAFCAAGKR